MNSHICPLHTHAHSFIHKHTHTASRSLSISFLYSCFVLLSVHCVKDILMSVVFDSDIPALTFTLADIKKVGQILLSLAM